MADHSRHHERVLTRRELNRTLLARQMLLQRARTSIPRALERIGTLQAQYAPSMYVGLWSRLEGLDRISVTRVLERRSAVQATLMRGTIHLVSRDDYWPLREAVRTERRRWYARMATDALDQDAMERMARELRPRFAEGPVQARELEQRVGKPAERALRMWLDLVRVPPAGTWERRRADLYGMAEDWIGSSDSSEEHGTMLLVRRYLQGFGPSTRHEIAQFTGLPLGRVDPALERLKLRRFRGEDGEPLVDLPRLPVPAGDAPAPVRLLPHWDATLLSHARRAGVLPERHRDRVFSSRRPHSLGTFLVDGSVAGAWHYEDGQVDLELWDRVDRAARRELDVEAAALERFHS